MHFHKHHYPANFEFTQSWKPGAACRIGETEVRLTVTEYEGGIFRVAAASARWPRNLSQAELALPPLRKKGNKGAAATLNADGGFGLRLTDAEGNLLLTSPRGATFGLCGDASMFMFHRDPAFQYYGMGEKSLGLELSGKRAKFWNTDVWGDFDSNAFTNGAPDPMYVAVPYLIVKRGNHYVGLLLNNPYASFISTADCNSWSGTPATDGAHKDCFWLGADNGVPELFILVGPTLAELTRKLQMLVGPTPLPPAWALGYHQCRWGYQSAADLNDLDEQFRHHGIPCDGLWLDIEYMDGYRVFTFEKKNFPELRKTLKTLKQNGRRVVPILDPGVKKEKGFAVYEDGRKAGAFCMNPQGLEYVGMVWPGETVFPDYSTEAGRAWWAGQVKRFAANGLYGAWLDMNDPSTGHIDNVQMLFDRGAETHDTYHNQYALGMAKASRAGFLAAHPEERPFLLCRSGFISTSRYTAIWTGDNVSNYHHLKNSIPCSLNLALSGIPFNGPDIGGFGGDATARIFMDWMKCGFLFPVCRNHTSKHCARKEPWAFGSEVMEVIREYIRLRYKLRPYLYNLFARQEECGEALLRPLFHDFADSAELPLGRIDDQFMIGPAILQAPFVTENARNRNVLLPAARWYAAECAGWVAGGRNVTVNAQWLSTPLYVRDGSIVPMAAGEAGGDSGFDGRTVEFHLFVSREFADSATTEYVFDDGLSFAYREGKRSRMRITARVGAGGELAITTANMATGFGPCQASFVLYDHFTQVTLNGKPVKTRKATWRFAGVEQKVSVVD